MMMTLHTPRDLTVREMLEGEDFSAWLTDLTATDPMHNLYDTRWPIWTYQPQLPPAKFVHNQKDLRGMAIESMVSGGCIVSGHVFRSVLSYDIFVLC